FGLTGRFYDFKDMPFDFNPNRQIYSMLIARGMYYENLQDVPADRRDLAVLQWKSEGQIEPPIMERLSAWGYRLVGTDDLRIPRFLSIFFWTVGAIGLLLLLRDLVGFKGAVIGLAYYLILPYAVYASRSFQPEPLMIASIIWSWWAMTRWIKRQTWKSAILAGLISGLAIYIKLPALFFVLPALIGVMLVKIKIKKLLHEPQILLIATLTVLPALLYHLYGLFIADFLQSQTNFRFFPELLTDPFHYLKWKDYIDKTLGIEFFLMGLLGSLLIKEKAFRVMMLSVFVGYFFYGLFFSYHIISHDYYQLPVLPAIAVGLAAIGKTLIDNFNGRKGFALVILGSLMFFWMSINFWDARMTLKHANFQDEPDFYASLGSKLKDYSLVSITPDYGYRLAYWGWKQSMNWLSVGDFNLRELAGNEIDQEQYFLQVIDHRDLFLVTDFNEFERQPAVKEILNVNFPIFEEGEGYLIYDLRTSP
ncbi:MAG: ArnT family glycosyltransferase, partial [Anaerolineales bacterium]